MPNGIIKFFNVDKGFGFVTADEGGKDLFLSSSAAAASGATNLMPGQRVSFEVQPDAKGPKAINLKIIANMQSQPILAYRHAPTNHAPPPTRLTIYLDPNCDLARAALDELNAAGETPHIVDYIASPPSRDELRRLSTLFRDTGQNIVRKYHPLFLELRLDDRFISEAEFWGSVSEHPSLINGPIIVGRGRAAICRTENAVEEFLALLSGKAVQQPRKPKGLPRATQAKITQAAESTAKSVITPTKSSDDSVKKLSAKDETRLIPKLVAARKAKATKKSTPKTKNKSKKKTKMILKKKTKKASNKTIKKKIKSRPR